MKRLYIALLLVIFAAQGIGVASGNNVLNDGGIFAHRVTVSMQDKVTTVFTAEARSEMDELKVFSIQEELSDYVVRELGLTKLHHQAPSVSTAAWIPASIILPRAVPPPRF